MPVLLALVLMIAGLGRTDLWGSDETRYAVAAREMRESGDWRHLTVNGRPYTKKPPVVIWAQVGIGALTGGIDEIEARLPNALGGVLSVLFVWLLGNALFGRRAAFLAAILLAATPVFVLHARMGRMDEVLTALVLASLYGFVLFERGSRPRWAVFLLLFAPLWIGVLTKWTAPLFVLPPIVLTLLIGGRKRPVPWVAAAVGVLLCALPLVLWVDWGEFGRILGGQAHRKPFHYLLGRFPLVTLPAFLLVPGALVLWRKGRAAPEDRRGLLLVAMWIAWGLLMLSVPGAKRASYLDPLIPAVPLLAGWFAARIGTEDARIARMFLRLPVGLLVFPICIATIYPGVFAGSVLVRLGAAVVLFAGIGLGLTAWLARPFRVATALALVSALACAIYFHGVQPDRNEERSIGPFMDVYHARAGPAADLRYLGAKSVLSHYPGPELVFYARRGIPRLKSEELAVEWLGGEEERYVILRPGRYRRLRELCGGALPKGLRVEAENHHDGNEYVLLSNRAGDGETVIFAPPDPSD